MIAILLGVITAGVFIVVIESVGDSDPVFAFVFLLISVGICLFIVLPLNGDVKIKEVTFKIINQEEIENLVKQGKLNEFDNSYVFYEADGEINKTSITECDVIFGNKYEYKEERQELYLFGSYISSNTTTCQLKIRGEEK